MIISVVAAKIWYLKNVQFSLGHPVQTKTTNKRIISTKEQLNTW